MSTSTYRNVHDSGVLLEAGTNEVEILVFACGGSRFGVNVAKVREVLQVTEVTAMQTPHPAVEGVVRIRDLVVSLVNLADYLYPGEGVSNPSPEDQMLLLEFNREQIAFRVQQTERIHRLSWNKVAPMPNLVGINAPVTAVLELQGSLVPMLDFESIGDRLGMISEKHGQNLSGAELAEQRAERRIFFADDSSMVRARIKDELREYGYQNIYGFADGQEAWKFLEKLAEQEGDQISVEQSLLITDVEMPRLDGLTLTRMLRQHPVWKDLSVVVFSSIASKDNEKKGKQVGANAQVTKPHYNELMQKLDELLYTPA